MTRFVRAPAKLNLGLEVIGRRADGYHELATVFQAIDLYDELRLVESEAFSYIGDPRIPPESDLVRPILEETARAQNWTSSLELRKRIPIAAGLGGGSSDAALALKLATFSQHYAGAQQRARKIGADVPFFLAGGAAYAEGIGDELEQLPATSLMFVLVTPKVDIPNKTASLFAGLQSSDFTSGEAVRRFADGLRQRGRCGSAWDARNWTVRALGEVPNAFLRQMLAFEPVRAAWEELREVSGRAALSGAGPTVYSWHTSYEEARAVLDGLGRSNRFVHIARGLLPSAVYREERHMRRLLARLQPNAN